MSKAKSKPIWNPDFSNLPSNIIGACFNPDGVAWAWGVKPEIKGSEKKPFDLKWRGSEYGRGYVLLGPVNPDVDKSKWKESWVDR
jgi:hypothetical protein